MNSPNKENIIKNNKIVRYLALSAVLISGLFLSACVSDPYEDDYGYRSSQGEYHGDYHDDGYVDEPNTRVEVYASSGSHRHRSSYYDPYYARHYNGYYFDPFYGVYYSYGSGAYGPYGFYRSGFGYYCPLHRSYYGHTHYRSHNHSRHHRNVIRYDRNHHRRDARHRDHRNRNNVIQPNTEAVAANTPRGSRNRELRNDRRNSNTSLGQRGLDGVVPTRERRLRTRDRRDTVQGRSPRTSNTVEPTQNSNSQTQTMSDARRRQIAAARAEQARRAAANSQNTNATRERRDNSSNTSSRREQTRERSQSRRSSNPERSNHNRSRSRSRTQRR